jgi:predicted Rossmann-fold nucleotide-binding protein
MGTRFWAPIRAFSTKSLLTERTICPGDLDLLKMTDSVDEALSLIRQGLEA